MSEPTHHSKAGEPSPLARRRPYDTPTLKVYGDLTSLTRSLKHTSGVDGHPGNGMSKTG